SMLVLTGVSGRGDVERLGIVPTVIAEDVSGLLESGEGSGRRGDILAGGTGRAPCVRRTSRSDRDGGWAGTGSGVHGGGDRQALAGQRPGAGEDSDQGPRARPGDQDRKGPAGVGEQEPRTAQDDGTDGGQGPAEDEGGGA